MHFSYINLIFKLIVINNLWSTCELISLLILQFYQHNHKCLIQGTHGTIPKKYYPVYFLEINCPKSELDCWFYNGAQTICFKVEFYFFWVYLKLKLQY